MRTTTKLNRSTRCQNFMTKQGLFMRKNILLITTALLLCSANAVAQDDDDFGGELSVEVEKKIKPGLSVEAGIAFRSQDDSKDMERFMASLGISPT